MGARATGLLTWLQRSRDPRSAQARLRFAPALNRGRSAAARSPATSWVCTSVTPGPNKACASPLRWAAERFQVSATSPSTSCPRLTDATPAQPPQPSTPPSTVRTATHRVVHQQQRLSRPVVRSPRSAWERGVGRREPLAVCMPPDRTVRRIPAQATVSASSGR